MGAATPSDFLNHQTQRKTNETRPPFPKPVALPQKLQACTNSPYPPGCEGRHVSSGTRRAAVSSDPKRCSCKLNSNRDGAARDAAPSPICSFPLNPQGSSQCTLNPFQRSKPGLRERQNRQLAPRNPSTQPARQRHRTTISHRSLQIRGGGVRHPRCWTPCSTGCCRARELFRNAGPPNRRGPIGKSAPPTWPQSAFTLLPPTNRNTRS